MKTLLLTIILCVAAMQVVAQDSDNRPVFGKIVRIDPKVNELLPADAKLELLATGFIWSEGPVWIKDGGYLLFSDIPRNSVMKWKAKDGISLYMKPAGFTGVGDYSREPGSNGIALDAKGRLYFCEHGDRRISMLAPGYGKVTIADRYQGKRFNSPNDLVVAPNGDVYFTDPIYGLPKQENDPSRELDFCGVYHYSAKDGSVTLLTKELTRPNGIAFSPDGKTLYVGQSDDKRPIVMAFPVLADGNTGKGRVFYDTTPLMGPNVMGVPDGMKVDAKGNVWTTGPGGVLIISPEGQLLGRIETGEPTSNCAWGDDGATLYITANHYLARVRTSSMGAGWK